MKVDSALVTDLAVCFIVFILLFFMLGTLANVGDETYGGTTTYTNIETFEDDTVGTNPNGNSSTGDNPFYTYNETTFGNTDDVTNASCYDGTQAMRYVENDSGESGDYYFLGEDGNELCDRTDISRIEWAINFAVNTEDNEVNTGVDYSLIDCDSSYIVWLTVNETNAILYTTGPTELMNISISDDDFYRCEVEIDYSGSDAPDVSSSFWSQDLAGLFTVEEDSNETEIDCSKLWLMEVSPENDGDDLVNTTFDDLQFEFDVDKDVTTGLEDLPVIWMMVIGVIILCIIVGVLFLIITEAKKKK